MGLWHLFIFIFLCYYTLLVRCQYGQKVNPIEEFSDHKAFKQLLRTRTNVMVLFMKHLSESSPIYKAYRETALEVRGIGTLVAVDCGGAGKKLCKNLKAYPDPHLLHHFKDGKFNKVYDRKETTKSLVRFMNDPTGDVPWEEEPSGKNVVHLGSPGSLDKLLKKNKPVLVMFYAPWCVYCKQMKPEFASAAAKVKANGDGILAAMDVLRPENIPIRMKYNITGFPTLYYFRDGKAVKTYDGDNKEDKFVEFMKDPTTVVTPTKEADWSDSVTDVVHLNQDNFDSTLLEEKSVLVMFYAPWCGHCKKMKPDYEKAATLMKKEKIPGILAAVDSTKETALSEKFGVRGFPTIKYFRDGEFAFNTPQLRDVSKLTEFMRQPKEPPPEPPPEPAWADVKSEVVHLGDENFKTQLRSKRHALVMFYAPWCGHCKQAKPEFTSAAEQLKDLPRTVLAAVDCDEHRALCKVNDIKGYPTFKYFRYYNKEPPQDYNGGRNAADFVKYMSKFEEAEYQTSAPEPAAVEKQDSKPVAVKQDTKPVVEKTDSQPAIEKQDPKPPKEISLEKVVESENVKKVEEAPWSQLEGGNKIIQLNSDNFENVLKQQSSIVVLFYAPWCVHCNNLKPAYANAAQTVETEFGVFGACDISVSEDIADKFLIKGLPTIKYFKNGEEAGTFSGARTTENFVAFLKKGGNAEKDEL